LNLLSSDLKPFLINYFDQIGWPDPFPGDYKYRLNKDVMIVESTTKIKDLVYDRSRYKEGKMPDFIYIPSSEMMFKMMKACISV